MLLVIVESPTKARTLSKFLAQEYRLAASMGHIRDLPSSKLGVDLASDFEPEYVTNPDKKKIVGQLQSQAKKAKTIILATDPDREGEAIAWHISVILGETHKFSRVVFHEITKEAVLEALKHPRDLDLNLVNAQQARRILDRLVGYKLSPLLWRKIRRGLSAGRVQSLALRFIVERERERQKFKPEEFWRLFADFSPGQNQPLIEAELVRFQDKRLELSQKHFLFDGQYIVKKTSISSRVQVQKIIKDLKAPFTVDAVDQKEIRKSPPPPFTTSTLQQAAANRFGFSAKRTMSLAQRLYEQGLITYHRTDSLNLSQKFLTAAAGFIKKGFGSEFALDRPRRFKTRSKTAQEAHEAIRPTDIKIQDPKINRDQLRLYQLIWRRALSSQAAPAVFASTKIKILSANQYEFLASGSVIKFEGYLKIAGYQSEDKILSKVKVGQTLKLLKTRPVQKNTSPPPRYSQASLIKALEAHGVGRPSTYAPIIGTILDRHYVELEEARFQPTNLGLPVNDFLVQHFPKIMDIPFTADMEKDLDQIAAGKLDWVPVLTKFYRPFEKILEQVAEKAERIKIQAEELKEKCPECEKFLVVRTGRFGKFIACSGFPDCKYTRQLVEKINLKCPECQKGEVVVKKTKKGRRRFYGCSKYPNCKFASWKKPK